MSHRQKSVPDVTVNTQSDFKTKVTNTKAYVHFHSLVLQTHSNRCEEDTSSSRQNTDVFRKEFVSALREKSKTQRNKLSVHRA